MFDNTLASWKVYWLPIKSIIIQIHGMTMKNELLYEN